MKSLFVEVPIPRRTPDNTFEAVIADTAPIRLLSLAEKADAAGHQTVLYPASADWNILLTDPHSTAASNLSERILLHGSEVIFLDVSYFNRPLVSRLLSLIGRRHSGDYPQILYEGGSAESSGMIAVVLNDHAEAASQLLGSFRHGGGSGGPDATPDSGDEQGLRIEGNGDKQTSQLSGSTQWVNQLAKWPRWERGVQTSDAFGFPLSSQPHPWNMPLQPVECASSVKEWLDAVAASLPELREPQVWLSNVGTLDREVMCALGEFSLNYIRKHGAAPTYGIRATPDQLDTSFALDNLAVLNVTKIDLSVGVGVENSLARYGATHTLEQVRQCARKIKEVGLAGRTRLSLVLGMPDEGMSEAVDTVNFSTGVAVENSIAEIKFEWWLNVTDSPFYKPERSLAEPVRESPARLTDDPGVLSRVPALITADDRQVLRGTVAVLRELHANLRVLGLELM